MKKIFLRTIMLFLSTLSLINLGAAERTITVGDTVRNYEIFYPSNYSLENEEPYDILLIMHPNGYAVSEFTKISSPQAISDINNAIVIYPQALDEQNEEILKLASTLTSAGIELAGFSTSYVWNSGASISVDELKALAGNYGSMLGFLIPNTVAKGKMVFNESAEDIAFIDALIDEIASKENGNKDAVFMVGASMGGAMTYKYAFNGNRPLKSIAVINGFVGKEISIPTSITLPICVFHSEADSIVKYEGGSINYGIEATVDTFVMNSGFEGEAKTEEIEDIAADGNKITKIIYDDGSHPKIHLFKSDKASHHEIFVSDYEVGPNDIDHIFECGKFFWGEKYGLGVDDIKNTEIISLYPNPTTDYVIIPTIGNYEIYSIQGDCVRRGEIDGNSINVSSLQSGNYIIKIIDSENIKIGKLIRK